MRLSLAEYRTGIRSTTAATRLWMVPLGLLLAAVGQILAFLTIFAIGATFYLPEMPMIPVMQTLATLQVRPVVFGILGSFFGALLFIVLWARFVHRISLRRLIGLEQMFLMRDFVLGVIVVLSFGLLIVFLGLYLGLYEKNVPIAPWLVWLLPALALIFVQVFTEELVFRGYLQPILAARFSSPLIWLVLPAALFGSLHYQPEVFGANAYLVVIATTLMGVVAGHVTARTGNISAAVGLHFANNCIGMLIVAVPGELSALSLYVHPIDPSDTVLTRGMLIGNIATITGAYGVYLWFLGRRDARLQ